MLHSNIGGIMSQVIRIPDTIYKRLENHAIGFDTPGGVIEKLLDFYEKYHHQTNEDLYHTFLESPNHKDLSISSDKTEIVLSNVKAKKKYALIPLSDYNRPFFPGYKVPFVLKTDVGEFETKVTSAPKGTQIGDPEAGTYIQGGLKPWFDSHRNLKDDDILIIEKIEDKLYLLTIKNHNAV